MWISEPTTHVCRGKGKQQRCIRCNGIIHDGLAYSRWVWKSGKNARLQVEFEHCDDYHCQMELGEEFEQIPVETSVAMNVVVKTRMVATVNLLGETKYSPEVYTDIEVGEPEPPANDGDDDIAF